jgi:hypothetical protein
MFLSKHHYTIELAKRGNRVYFLNPPEETEGRKLKKDIEITPSETIPNLYFIQHRLFFPYNIKFHAQHLYQWLMGFHIRKLLKALPELDIVWSFDLGNLYPLKLFGKKPYKIFHPVDEPLDAEAINSALGSAIILSLTPEILEKYKELPAPRHFINHGLPAAFLKEYPNGEIHKKIRVGISGNFLRPDLDRDTIIKIIEANPDLEFHFYGSYKQSQSNIGGGEDPETIQFIERLAGNPHVVLHGALPTPELAAALFGMDCFLICYDIKKDQSKGTNYHKIMEYLSTGKTIVSNNVTTYQGMPDLLRMPESRENNALLPALFRETVQNLSFYNSPELREKRKAFARENSYPRQLDKIEALLP